MPWLPLYATEADLRWLFEMLSTEPETAFLVSDGEHRWIAIHGQTYHADGRYCLWHVPSGPLPLFRGVRESDGVIEDPWGGWREERAGADRKNPFFGSGHVGVIWLNAHAKGNQDAGIGLSSFEWIGNHYRLIGRPAPVVTERFWKRLGRIVKKHAVRIPRSGPWDGPNPEIWTLPDAMKQIMSGRERDRNPYHNVDIDVLAAVKDLVHNLRDINGRVVLL